MATFHAASAIGETIAKLLERSVPGGDRDFTGASFLFVNNFRSPPSNGVTVYLYRVALCPARHNFPARTNPQGQRLKRALPLDFYYMLTGWGGDARRQAALLVWALRTLEDLASIPAAVINGFYGTDAAPFRTDESVQIGFDTLLLQDQVNIWEIAKQSMQPSVGCVARAVPIETEATESEHPPVQTRELRLEEREPQ